MSVRPAHELSVRVYYEDTDFSGRVYHASYLRFLERGRTEWLREMGVAQSAAAGADGLVFAVRSLQIDFLAPALMDDLLSIVTEARTARGASLEFRQAVMRDATTLAAATVTVVAIRGDRATRIPVALRAALAPKV